MTYSPAWPHSEIKEMLPNVFFVMGTNITHYNNVELQHSRNMIILRHNDELSLINTVRLTEEGLAELDKLGTVKNIIGIGSFHGRDDQFYVDRYSAKHIQPKDFYSELKQDLPIPNCSVFIFETSVFPEVILHLEQEGGILITCDSIKNWVEPDEFFSEATAKLYKQQHFFGTATISKVWQDACQVKSSDVERLKKLKFRHLFSAHGEPLLNNAYECVIQTIKKEYGI